MKKTIKKTPVPARKRRAINEQASEFAIKAVENHQPDGSKNLSEFYCGCVHGIAVVCNILNLNSEEIDSLMKELNTL